MLLIQRNKISQMSDIFSSGKILVPGWLRSEKCRFFLFFFHGNYKIEMYIHNYVFKRTACLLGGTCGNS